MMPRRRRLFALKLAAALILAPAHMVVPVPAVAAVDGVCTVAPEIAGPDCGHTGDDNGDGWLMEDESGWDCRTMGNRVCGPVGGVR